MALTQWQLKPVATETTIASGDFLAFTDEDEAGDPINKITIDNLATFLAGGSNLSASSGVLSATDTNTTYTGGTNLTLVGTTFNVDDSFLTNTGDDSTSHTITMAHLIIGDGGNIGSASDTDAIAISSGGDVTFSQDVLISDATYVKLGGTRAATIEPAANQTGYGVVVMFDSAGSVSLGDAVFINTSGKVAQANAVTGSVTNPAIGIALNAGGSDGDDVYVLTHGVWRNDDEDFSSSVGSPVYLGESVGAITKTAPSTDGDYVQRLGIAISDDCMLVMPSIDVIEHA